MSKSNSSPKTPQKKQRLPLVLGALAGLIFGGGLATFLASIPETTEAPATATTGKAAIGGPFSLVDQTGKRVSEKDFLGKPMLVYFGFTHCPDICPSGLQVIAGALDALGSEADKVTAVFVTLDPERDTPAVMGEYVKSFSPKIVGLSGSLDEVKAMAKTYKVFMQKVVDEKSGTYSVDHSSFMYVMNRSGEFAQHLPHSVSIDDLAAALKKQL